MVPVKWRSRSGSTSWKMGRSSACSWPVMRSFTASCTSAAATGKSRIASRKGPASKQSRSDCSRVRTVADARSASRRTSVALCGASAPSSRSRSSNDSSPKKSPAARTPTSLASGSASKSDVPSSSPRLGDPRPARAEPGGFAAPRRKLKPDAAPRPEPPEGLSRTVRPAPPRRSRSVAGRDAEADAASASRARASRASKAAALRVAAASDPMLTSSAPARTM